MVGGATSVRVSIGHKSGKGGKSRNTSPQFGLSGRPLVILSPSDWCDTRAVFRIAVLPIVAKLRRMSMAFQNFLTPIEAANVIGCTDGRVRQLLRDGKLLGQKINARMWLIPADEAQKMRDLPVETGRPRKNKKSC